MRGLTRVAARAHAGVSPATVSLSLAQDHIPTFEILFRLADYFGTLRETFLHVAARRRWASAPPGGKEEDDGFS